MTKLQFVNEIARIDREATMQNAKGLKSRLITVIKRAIREGMSQEEALSTLEVCRITMEEQRAAGTVGPDCTYDFSAVVGK